MGRMITAKERPYFEYDLYSAQRYGNVFEKAWHNRRIKCLLNLIERSRITKDAKIIEIGCNTGPVIIALGRNGYRNLYGMDISWKNVIRAKDNCARQLSGDIPLCVADVCAAPFRPGAFDAVFLIDVLEHAFKIEKIVTEVRRILRPGGKAVVAMPHRYHPASSPWIKKILSGRDDIDTLPDHFLAKEDVERLFSGFDAEYFGLAAFLAWFCFIFKKPLGSL